MGKMHKEKESIEAVKSKGVIVEDNYIYVPNDHAMGNKTLGKLDYLANILKYKLFFLPYDGKTVIKKLKGGK